MFVREKTNDVSAGLEGENYANWLLRNRKPTGRWVSLRDSVAAMQALSEFARRSTPHRRSARSLQLQVRKECEPMCENMATLINYRPSLQKIALRRFSFSLLSHAFQPGQLFSDRRPVRLPPPANRAGRRGFAAVPGEPGGDFCAEQCRLTDAFRDWASLDWGGPFGKLQVTCDW